MNVAKTLQLFMIDGNASVDVQRGAVATLNSLTGLTIQTAAASVKIHRLTVIRLNFGIKGDVPVNVSQYGAQKASSKTLKVASAYALKDALTDTIGSRMSVNVC